MENWSEVIIFKAGPSISEEVLKDIMSSNWRDLSKKYSVVILFFELVRESIVSFIDFDELFVGSFIIGIVFRMIFKGKLSVGILDVIECCRLW